MCVPFVHVWNGMKRKSIYIEKSRSETKHCLVDPPRRLLIVCFKETPQNKKKKEPPTPPFVWCLLSWLNWNWWMYFSSSCLLTCMDATDGRRHGDGDATGGRVCPTADRRRRDEESQRRDGRTGTDSHGWIIAAVAESSLTPPLSSKTPPPNLESYVNFFYSFLSSHSYYSNDMIP